MRHAEVAATVTVELQHKGFNMRREHLFRTSAGARKPDLLVSKDGKGHMLDVQILSASRRLAEERRLKNNYYAENNELIGSIAKLLQVPVTHVSFSTVTFIDEEYGPHSWRTLYDGFASQQR